MGNKYQIGNKINRWTILEKAKSSGYRKQWFCECECGNKKIVLEQNLRLNKSKSCGCYSRDITFTGYKEIPGIYWSRIRADAKRRNFEFNITIEYAFDLFIKQNKKCALSNQNINFAKTTKEHWDLMTTASLDRIDSTKGYVENNIQWVHKDINKMKQNFEESYFIELCKLVWKYNE